LRLIPELSRKRALNRLGEIANEEGVSELRALLAVFLFTALMKEIVGGKLHIFTFFDRQHTFEEVYKELEYLMDECGLHKFKGVQGGMTDQHNYIRILTVDSIYDRKYLIPIYETMLAAERAENDPEAPIDTTRPFLYVPEAQFVDFSWVLQELLIHLDRPFDIKTLYCIPPEIEPIKQLVTAALTHAGLTYDIVDMENPNHDETEYEISAIDPDRYGLLLQVMEKPDRLNEELREQLDQLKATAESI